MNLPGYTYARDPQAVAVVKNLSNAKSYGCLPDVSGVKGFQIEMAAFLADAAAGTTGSDAHLLAADPVAASIVKPIAF